MGHWGLMTKLWSRGGHGVVVAGQDPRPPLSCPLILSLALSLPSATGTKWCPWTLFAASTETASYAGYRNPSYSFPDPAPVLAWDIWWSVFLLEEQWHCIIMILFVCHNSKRCLMTWGRVFWWMPGKATTVHCLLTGKRDLASPTLWLAMATTKVSWLNCQSYPS